MTITSVSLPRTIGAAAASVSSARTQRGVVPGQNVGQLPTAVDSELSKHLSQMPFNSARAEEQSRADLRIGAYGYRRLHKALQREGVDVGRDQVAVLMRSEGLQGAKRRGKPWRTTRPDPGGVRRPDLVNRQFSAARPNALWLADFTYLRCWEGTVFLSFVIDAFSRRVVGWHLASHMRTDLVLDALRMALGTREPGADLALVHHSDAGSQYTSFDYTQVLDDHSVLASIGTVGDAYDNALAESFIDSFKTELIADPRVAQQSAARARRRRVPQLV